MTQWSDTQPAEVLESVLHLYLGDGYGLEIEKLSTGWRLTVGNLFASESVRWPEGRLIDVLRCADTVARCIDAGKGIIDPADFGGTREARS